MNTVNIELFEQKNIRILDKFCHLMTHLILQITFQSNNRNEIDVVWIKNKSDPFLNDTMTGDASAEGTSPGKATQLYETYYLD